MKRRARPTDRRRTTTKARPAKAASRATARRPSSGPARSHGASRGTTSRTRAGEPRQPRGGQRLGRADPRRSRPDPDFRSKPPQRTAAGRTSITRPRRASIARPQQRALHAPSTDRILESQPWDSLIPHLLKAEATPDQAIERLRSYARVLLDWNRNVSNLISSQDERRIVERHIAESVEPAAWLKSSGQTRWLDFGSGGGLPALPLALLGVGEEWTLVESRRTKTLFLRRAIETLELKSVEVILSRIEDLEKNPMREGSFGAFTSRATLPLGPTLEIASYFVPPGGFAFLWKGSRREEEMRSDRRWERSWELDGLLGIGSGQTVVARFSRKQEE